MATEEIPPDGVNHYSESAEMPDNIQKYWHQRYDLFEKYDHGIWLTDDAWFGVTPEPVANKIATHLSTSSPPQKRILIDAFAGAGGNTIAFARSGRWDQIFAIEKDATVLACAKHNAALYGVKNKIVWIQGDCFDVLNKRLKSFRGKSVVFGSPPWGGTEYGVDEVMGLSGMQPYGLEELWRGFGGFGDVCLYLPRNGDLNELAVLARQGAREEKVRVTHYCMRGASKAICAFFGEWDFA